MAQRPRILLHTCNQCSAIWEGPNPPQVCPQCGTEEGWRSAEIGDQPGAVGGRLFVPGTDRPMTAIYICTACTKTIVVRNGGDEPTECPFCHASADHITEAMVKKPPVPPTVGARVGAHAAKEEAAVDRRLPTVFVPEGDRALVPGGGDIHIKDRIPEKSEGETTPVLTADQYRSEWISQRIEAFCDNEGLNEIRRCGTAEIERMWTLAEGVYDEGKRRGHLP